MDELPMTSMKEFWLARASRAGHLSAPGEPSDEDLRVYSGYADNLQRAQAASGKSGLLLGVTQAIVDWSRKLALHVTVMDFCEPLAQRLQSICRDWEGFRIIVDNWLTTVQKDHSFCWAAGDGVVNAVGTGRNAVTLFGQIRRLLSPGSIFIQRLMIRPSTPPDSLEILQEAAAGRIHSLGALKHQVAQSLQPSFMDGVKLSEVRNAILDSGILPRNSDGHYRWSHEPLSALDYYSIEGASLCYPTLEELRKLTSDDFEELTISYGDYEMGQLCPTIVYRTRERNHRYAERIKANGNCQLCKSERTHE
jgi:hypothetical protein